MTNKAPYFAAFVMMVISFVLCCIAYGTGYWFEARGEDRLFQRLGLWEACFDGYEHTSDYIGKAYYGCWWIFHKEYSYIREWIMPSWFIGVQTMMTFALIFEFINLAMYPMAAKEVSNIRTLTITCVTSLFTLIFIGISVTVFAIMIGEDRTWMPRPDIDTLGWSFWLAVTSGFLAAFATISITVYTLMRKYELRPPDYEKNKSNMMPMVPKV